MKISKKEKESLTEFAHPCLLTLLEESNEGKTVSCWGVYFAEEGCSMYYLLRFQTDYFTKEEVLAILETVTFADRAFY